MIHDTEKIKWQKLICGRKSCSDSVLVSASDFFPVFANYLVKYTSQTDKEFFDEIELFFAVAIFRLGKFAAISKSAATASHSNARYATAIGGLRAGHW